MKDEKIIPYLSLAQRELLAILSEEMGEAQQAIGKINRHGYESKNPLLPNSITNRESLTKELGHIMYAVQMIVKSGELTDHYIEAEAKIKAKTIKAYLHHQGEQ